MFKKKIRLTEANIVPPYNFDFHLHHYVLPPERREEDCLIEVVRLSSGQLTKVDVISKGTTEHPLLELTIWSTSHLTNYEVVDVIEQVSWHLCLKEDLTPFYSMTINDPIMKASIEYNFGAKDKAKYSMFEALIDCVCAQNTIFKRLYSMLGNLSTTFGEQILINGETYSAFPTPKQLGEVPLEALRACKVGYRDKYIQRICQEILNEGVDLEKVKAMPLLDEARTELMKLPGIGPYTADLALIIGARRLDLLHMDLFIRETLTQFYFDGREVPDKMLREFAAQRWGPYRAHAGLYLTTNTEVWAKKIGIEFRLQSGAKG